MRRLPHLSHCLAVLGAHFLLAGNALAGAITFGLLPAQPPPAGDTVILQVVVLNTGPEAVPLALANWPARLKYAGGSLAVEAEILPCATTALEPGRFAVVAFRCPLPAAVHGSTVVVIQPPEGPELQAVLDLPGASAAAFPPPLSAEHPARHALEPSNPDSMLHRYFAERFGPHEPVYFIYGPDDPVAKLQFSLKYRLLDFARQPAAAPLNTLQFGYTQRSLWDIRGSSSPFYDSSYIPELFFESLAAHAADSDGFCHGLGLQTGFLHESNGRDGFASRSVNHLFVRSYFLLGSTSRWHAVVAPELFLYLSSMGNNPRLKNYRGYGRLRFALGYGDGPSLTFLGYGGKDFDHPTLQVDLAVPLRIALFDFKTFLLIQYFNGYGESLLDYERHTQTVRAGMALVR